MTQTLERIDSQTELPSQTEVVIIGAGIVGISAALTLAERNIPVVVIEKGHIGGEQSSRNLGWVRKTSRDASDIPLAAAADRLWGQMPERIGREVGYQSCGILFAVDTEEEMAKHQSWYESIKGLDIDSQLLSAKDINRLVPGSVRSWMGGLYTPSDGRAEPSKAVSAMAQAAMNKGAIIIQHCAVRHLETSGGAIRSVVTEKGTIGCSRVLLAGGAWSRRFLSHHNISLPTLPLKCSVLRTKPMQGPTDIAVGAPDFSFRKHEDGGFIITQRGALDAPITLDHLLIGHRYLSQLKNQRRFLRVSLGKAFFSDLALGRRWSPSSVSPFEKIRTMNPPHNAALNQEAMTHLSHAWPVFKQAQIAEAWAGIIDVTPDSNPVIDHIDAMPGLTLASGFSGHGFGTGPAAGQLAADLIMDSQPLTDPTPYRFARF